MSNLEEKIIKELKEIDFSMRLNEVPFTHDMRLCSEIMRKVIVWRTLLDKEAKECQLVSSVNL